MEEPITGHSILSTFDRQQSKNWEEAENRLTPAPSSQASLAFRLFTCNAVGPEGLQHDPQSFQQFLTVLQFSIPSTGQLQTCIQRGHFYSSS